MPGPELHHEDLAPRVPIGLPRELTSPARSKGGTGAFWRGLIWGEWYAHSRLILFFLGAWLLLVWVLPRFVNPGWLLAFGCAFALVAGPALGGKAVLEGCEEYGFSLPATRGEWYSARWCLGTGLLLLFTLLDLLALGLDLSQAMTRFYLDTRLIEPRGVPRPALLYGLTLAFPLACFSTTFAVAANARSRGVVLSAPLWGGLVALAVLRLGLLYEYWEWQAWKGYFACPALLVAALAAAGWGAHRFRLKELVPPTKPWNMPTLWWVWVLLVLGSLGLITFLLSSLGKELADILGR